jgi:hypothetical protein
MYSVTQCSPGIAGCMVSSEMRVRRISSHETHPVFLLRISSQINDREAKVDIGNFFFLVIVQSNRFAGQSGVSPF